MAAQMGSHYFQYRIKLLDNQLLDGNLFVFGNYANIIYAGSIDALNLDWIGLWHECVDNLTERVEDFNVLDVVEVTIDK